MSWLFSRALVAASLGGNSSAGEPSAPLNLMPTPQPFLHNGKTTAFSKPSQYGLTYELLTADRGEALLMWFRAGFRARTSAPPVKAQASKAPAPASGWRWPASYAKYDPAERSWRTRQSSLLGGSESFSETWPRWGSMRNGECLARRPWAPLTSASASGSWPTPKAQNTTGAGIHGDVGIDLQTAVKLWATPCTPNGGRSNKPEDIASNGLRADGRKVQVSLESQAKSWQTPRANDSEKRGDFNAMDKRNGLAGEAKAWGTPTARDHKDSGDCSNVPDNGLLGRMVKSWSGTTDQPGSLSPAFHLWLMGWPAEWNALDPLEMGKYRLWLQQHGRC